MPEFLVVAVDGGNSFFVNGPTGRFEDMATQRPGGPRREDLSRRTRARGPRALLGISMGGYAALRLAFEQPSLYRAVATHSAMLLERIPSTDQGAGRWHMAAFNAVFGNPIDPRAVDGQRPDRPRRGRSTRRRRRPSTSTAATEDRFGLAAGHRDLDAVLNERKIAHTLRAARRATTATTSCARGSRGACASSANC